MVVTRSQTHAAPLGSKPDTQTTPRHCSSSKTSLLDITTSKTKRKVKITRKISTHFEKPALHAIPIPVPADDPANASLRPPPANEPYFGLIQESLTHSLFALCVQSILWNQTRGSQARPVLIKILSQYPTPESLAAADVLHLTTLLQPIGLHNQRAKRLKAFGQAWIEQPPRPDTTYVRKGYPPPCTGGDCVDHKVIIDASLDTLQAMQVEGFEIAHLPGMGAYAIDSYRIFFRDRLRGLEDQVTAGTVTPEWKRVVPTDKELRRYLIWRWGSEGWDWDPIIGRRMKRFQGEM